MVSLLFILNIENCSGERYEKKNLIVILRLVCSVLITCT